MDIYTFLNTRSTQATYGYNSGIQLVEKETDQTGVPVISLSKPLLGEEQEITEHTVAA